MHRISLILTLAAPLAAGPLEFGREELERAFASRGLAGRAASVTAKVLPDGKPECYTVSPGAVTGGDERGLMYGLLAAAEQIRGTGRIASAAGCPAVPMRGIRYFLHNRDLEREWYYSNEYWDRYFAMLARNRFNRFNLVFAHQTNYLAPPYPFWLALPEFPQIRVPGLSDADRERNLAMLRYISQAAADHGIDFTLGVWEHNIQTTPHKMIPTTEGITRENVGPYSYAALKKILQLCPAIRSVQMRTNEESGIPKDYRNEFYRNYVFAAIRDAGRPVYLDLRAWAVAKDMIQAAEEVGIPLRVSTKYWAEDLGRPYQPAETYAGYSYLNFLEKPHSYQFYFELWGLGSHRLLLWGNPDYVRRAASTFSLGDAVGFEIDPPLAQKGFDNRPGRWGIFTDAHKNRVFWKWEFERYWAFYQLWGRLTYNPAESDAVWLAELRRRFGAAAPDVLEAYRNSGRVLNEIVAAHLADPNMYIWPEINPGGLLDAYRDVLPSDWRYVSTIPEAVQNRISRTASAKQTPRETAALLNGLARRTEEAVARAAKRIPADNVEWRSSRPDFEVLSLLARYHAHKQAAADQTAYFDATADRAALDAATRELEGALAVWERLVRLTDGLYPAEMAFGPADVGHWKEKLPYVRHDLELVRERAAVLEKFGRFDAAFDFGGPVRAPNPASYHNQAFVVANTVAPRFRPVDPDTLYTGERGYGWLSAGERAAEAIPLTPYAEVRATAAEPRNLPRDVLYRDFIRGKGAQTFRVRIGNGAYNVRLLHPGRTETALALNAEGGFLDIPFPAGVWEVSGVVVQGAQSRAPLAPQRFPELLPRPKIEHQAPRFAAAGQPLELRLKISPADRVTRIRLHYRPVNQQAKFKTIELAAGERSFTIPGAEISAKWDLMYYFEILHAGGSGWFHPDPHTATPYRVVKIKP
ncbi:MAG: hypothetical protein ACE15B_04180 [Bryobacteraceae bacterium]